jgi:hypothetical protein
MKLLTRFKLKIFKGFKKHPPRRLVYVMVRSGGVTRIVTTLRYKEKGDFK